jgi:hypothetical protein
LAAAIVALALPAGCASTVAHDQRRAPRPRALVLPRPEKNGRWTKLLLSPDGSTYLGQWSGECEIQTAYLVPARRGTAWPVTDYLRGSAQSIALGWAGSRARVRLPQGQPPVRRPGVYLVDPRTMTMTLERPVRRKPGC